MNKTFTAAIAITVVAGLASAEIATDPAGYVETNGTDKAILVCNPFYSFDNGANTTLADIDGSDLGIDDYLQVVGNDGKVLLKARWYNGHWYDYSGNSYETSKDGYSLPRGTSVRFVSASGKAIVLSGVLTNLNATASYTAKGNFFVGNASSVDKKLGDFGFSTFNANYDYVDVNGTKYVRVSRGGKTYWYERSAYQTATSYSGLTDYSNLTIPVGSGIRVFNGKQKAEAVTVTLPGTY